MISDIDNLVTLCKFIHERIAELDAEGLKPLFDHMDVADTLMAIAVLRYSYPFRGLMPWYRQSLEEAIAKALSEGQDANRLFHGLANFSN